VSACSLVSPHISTLGFSEAQTAGRSGRPNNLQRACSSSCTHGTPAGLPPGMPGKAVVMEGAVQQAPQPGRQSILGMLSLPSAELMATAGDDVDNANGNYSCWSA
jgi:hypothetical protein